MSNSSSTTYPLAIIKEIVLFKENDRYKKAGNDRTFRVCPPRVFHRRPWIITEGTEAKLFLPGMGGQKQWWDGQRHPLELHKKKRGEKDSFR